MTDLSVIIVSFNTRDLLRACLRSVRASRPAQVLVVDNASTDGSADVVAREFPGVELIASSENLGFVRANNLALPQATGSHILLLNPDAEVQPGALDKLQSLLDSRPRAGVVGPRLTYADGSLQHAAFAFPTLAQTYFEFFPRPGRLLDSRLNGRFPRQWYSGLPFEADFVLGACLMVKRQAMNAVGLLDEGYFMYCEEMDWCRRMKRAGWGVWCEPRATVVHHEAQSSRQTRWASFVEKWRSRMRFYGLYYPAWWRSANGLLIRFGLAAESRRARQAHRKGELGDADLAQRLDAYQQVAGLTRARP